MVPEFFSTVKENTSGGEMVVVELGCEQVEETMNSGAKVSSSCVILRFNDKQEEPSSGWHAVESWPEVGTSSGRWRPDPELGLGFGRYRMLPESVRLESRFPSYIHTKNQNFAK